MNRHDLRITLMNTMYKDLLLKESVNPSINDSFVSTVVYPIEEMMEESKEIRNECDELIKKLEIYIKNLNELEEYESNMTLRITSKVENTYKDTNKALKNLFEHIIDLEKQLDDVFKNTAEEEETVYENLKFRFNSVEELQTKFMEAEDRLAECFAKLSKLKEMKVKDIDSYGYAVLTMYVRNKHDLINKISTYLRNFEFNRLNYVEQAILLLAVIEIELGEVDKRVAINEAIELAKQFSLDDTYKFINGVLDNYGK